MTDKNEETCWIPDGLYTMRTRAGHVQSLSENLSFKEMIAECRIYADLTRLPVYLYDDEGEKVIGVYPSNTQII
nr:MAG TPA: Protein of unknown function (DUF3269) [Caudoviricetes sp.]